MESFLRIFAPYSIYDCMFVAKKLENWFNSCMCSVIKSQCWPRGTVLIYSP